MANSKKLIVEIENLHKAYGKEEVLKGINMSVTEGEVVVLVGPSGTGKSTLLRCINQLTIPDSGRVLVNGIELTDPQIDIDKARQHIGMVFQDFNLFNHLTALDNIFCGEPCSTILPCSIKMMRWQTSRAKPISWVTHIMVIPPSARSFMTFRTSPINSGSRAEVGSSNNITIGSIASDRAMATRCF